MLTTWGFHLSGSNIRIVPAWNDQVDQAYYPTANEVTVARPPRILTGFLIVLYTTIVDLIPAFW